jgi:acetolactate synthase I/II/III large subunit
MNAIDPHTARQRADSGRAGNCPASTEVTVAECLEQVLVQHGIQVLPLLPGGPLTPLLEAVHRRGRLRTVLCRHESGAVMMADGYFRLSRRLAAVAVTAGPGLSNAVTAVALAHEEQIPLLLISAQVASECLGRTAAQELDTVTLLRSVTKASLALESARRTQATLSNLLRVAISGRPGPVHLSVPANLWRQRATIEPTRLPRTRPRPSDPRSIHTALQLLERAKQPVLLAGYGVVQSQAHQELLGLAQRLPHLQVACTPRSKGVFPESHPQSLGVFGFAGHARAETAMLDDSDLVLVVGSRLGEISSSSWDMRLGRRPLIQIDIESAEIGRNFPVEIGLVGDARELLRQLREAHS